MSLSSEPSYLPKLKELLGQLEDVEVEVAPHWEFFSVMAGGGIVAFIKRLSDGAFVWQNEEYKKAFECGDSQIGKINGECWPPIVAAALREHDLKIAQSGKPSLLVEVVPLPSGTRRWLVYKFVFVHAEAGRCIGGFAFPLSDDLFDEFKLELVATRREA